MSLTFTPGQLSRRAEFYYQLSQLTIAGIGLVNALNQIQKHPPARSYRQPVQRVLEQLNRGFTFSESLRQIGPWLPEFDTTLIAAGEQSGRIEQSFRLLSDHYNERSRMAKQMISDLAYPVFLFHFFIFITPFPAFFASGNVGVYLLKTLGPLIPIYLLTFLFLYSMQSRHGESWRAFIESILHPVPVVGTARRHLALARLAAALEALLSAGVGIIEAWEMAASASGSPALRRLVTTWRPLLNQGQTPAEIINASGRFPDLFASQYTAGEMSGKLEDCLRRLSDYYQDDGSRKVRAVAKWVPMFIYLVVMGVIAYNIISFYMGQFNTINAITGQ
ncbi:MAG: type II secretion system F family protein [Verrucomicrobiota bacterium]